MLDKIDVTTTRIKAHTWLAATLAFIVGFLRGPAQGFVYDASHYWSGAYSLVVMQNPYEAGWLAVRGLLSSVIYVPATIASLLAGPWIDGYSVLAQNSAALAFLGAVLVPRIIQLLGIYQKNFPAVIWLSAIIIVSVFAGFTPYPLMDLWGLISFFLGIYFFAKSPNQNLIYSWILFGVTVNLRPAYLAPVLVLFIWTMASNFRAIGKPLFTSIAGIVIAVSPQIIFNLIVNKTAVPWPVEMSKISSTQSTFASFIVRYDTVPFDTSRGAAQFFCSPEMGSILSTGAPTESFGVLREFALNMPTSLTFVLEKLSSSMMWAWETPYLSSVKNPVGLIAIFISIIIGLGISGLFMDREIYRKQNTGSLKTTLGLSFLSITGTMVLSTVEARFAAPLIVATIIGAFALGEKFLERRSQFLPIAKLLLGVAIGFSVLSIGSSALDHPAPPGLVSPEICSSLLGHIDE